MKTIHKTRFSSLGKEIALLQEGKVFHIIIENTTPFSYVRIENANPRLYKQLSKIYKKLNKLMKNKADN